MPGVIRIDHAGVIALLSDGFSMSETARRMGSAKSHIQWIAGHYRDDYPGVRRPGSSKSTTISPMTGLPVVRIRVPVAFERAGLAEDYRDLCRDFGMIEGERRCRRLLVEMGAAPVRHPTPLAPPLQARASDGRDAS